MKILMVSPYPPQPDGIGVHAKNLVRALGGRVAVAVLTCRGHPERDDAEEHVCRVLSTSPLSLPRTIRAVHIANPDIIHYQFNIPALGISWIWAILAGVITRRERGAKLLFTLHEVRRDTTLLGPVGRLLYRLIAHVADALIVYTAEARGLLVERCGIPAAMITLMPHGAPDTFPRPTDDEHAELLARYGLSKDPVLYFGYIHPDKGIEHLIDAVAELEQRSPGALDGVAVLIAGQVRTRQGVFRYFERKDHAYERDLHTAVERLGLQLTVRFIGYVDQRDTNVLLQSARCAVLPYMDATQSGVLNLLIAARTPVIANNLPGLQETLGDAGLLVEPGSAADLALALSRLLDDKELCDTLVERMATLHDAITFTRVGEMLVATYRQLLQHPHAST